MLEAIEIMYHEGCIPYISDVNKNCLDKLLWYIEDAKKKQIDTYSHQWCFVSGLEKTTVD
ncbi:hypothetical protein [Veillonella sp.]|uniref:hypothetical protein n=1 Tax=Veillonella sp. TaxID=1926307 RepID=UPI0025D0010F|nr:hypothetical protein [Veillonella sp.]